MKHVPVFIVLSMLLLPPVAFAQDVGEILFHTILRMSAYPGPPFTGNIIDDLVMFFFIPTVFIIVVLYTLAGRLTDNPKLDLLLTITFYLFIIFGGFYQAFALLAGPYFLFLLVFLGLFMFFVGHFGLRRRNAGLRAAGMPATTTDTAMLELRYTSLKDQLTAARRDLEKSKREYMDFGKKGGDTSFAVGELGQTRSYINTLLGELREVQVELRHINPRHRLVAQINADLRRFGFEKE